MTDATPPSERPPKEAPSAPAEATSAPPDKAPDPAGAKTRSPAGGPALPLGAAGVLAVLLVFAAIGTGLAIGTVARPSPTPRPTPTSPPPTRTPVPTTDPTVFRQQLSSGCATGQAIWVVSSGGGLLRYDGKDWSQVDSTLRTLTQASCDARTLYAVGPVGAVLIVDDLARSINAFDVTLQDLRGVAAMPTGAMTSGALGTVLLLHGGTWQPYAAGIDEDLNALVVFGLESAWAVGSQGISYRLEVAGWRAVPTGVDVTLRAIAGGNVRAVVAVGDGGTIVALSGATWSKVDSGVQVPLRSVAAVGSTAWIVGDDGVVLTAEGVLRAPEIPAKEPVVERVDIGTTCALTSVFAQGQDIWIIGSSGGGRAGVWKLRDKRVVERWGEC
ncbi:MAG TPA: hypothetical protein VJP45_03165 [Candidatus Limnocylindria bacterium]|nr:hypothetical protein [Candidatus Limnocylindria bacterium]